MEDVAKLLAQSLVFKVEAVPQDDVSSRATAHNMTPMNVKIRVRKKDGGNNSDIICVPKSGNPDSRAERLRLASSDHTLLSFNMLMETEHERKRKSRKSNFFGSCLGAQTDDDDGPYLPTTDSRSESRVGKSVITNTQNAPPSELRTTALIKKNTNFFGACKPGGCLDPPFGEDRYAYQPARLKQNMRPESVTREKEVKEAIDGNEERPLPPIRGDSAIMDVNEYRRHRDNVRKSFSLSPKPVLNEKFDTEENKDDKYPLKRTNKTSEDSQQTQNNNSKKSSAEPNETFNTDEDSSPRKLVKHKKTSDTVPDSDTLENRQCMNAEKQQGKETPLNGKSPSHELSTLFFSPSKKARNVSKDSGGSRRDLLKSNKSGKGTNAEVITVLKSSPSKGDGEHELLKDDSEKKTSKTKLRSDQNETTKTSSPIATSKHRLSSGPTLLFEESSSQPKQRRDQIKNLEKNEYKQTNVASSNPGILSDILSSEITNDTQYDFSDDDNKKSRKDSLVMSPITEIFIPPVQITTDAIARPPDSITDSALNKIKSKESSLKSAQVKEDVGTKASTGPTSNLSRTENIPSQVPQPEIQQIYHRQTDSIPNKELSSAKRNRNPSEDIPDNIKESLPVSKKEHVNAYDSGELRNSLNAQNLQELQKKGTDNIPNKIPDSSTLNTYVKTNQLEAAIKKKHSDEIASKTKNEYLIATDNKEKYGVGEQEAEEYLETDKENGSKKLKQTLSAMSRSSQSKNETNEFQTKHVKEENIGNTCAIQKPNESGNAEDANQYNKYASTTNHKPMIEAHEDDEKILLKVIPNPADKMQYPQAISQVDNLFRPQEQVAVVETAETEYQAVKGPSYKSTINDNFKTKHSDEPNKSKMAPFKSVQTKKSDQLGKNKVNQVDSIENTSSKSIQELHKPGHLDSTEHRKLFDSQPQRDRIDQKVLYNVGVAQESLKSNDGQKKHNVQMDKITTESNDGISDKAVSLILKNEQLSDDDYCINFAFQKYTKSKKAGIKTIDANKNYDPSDNIVTYRTKSNNQEKEIRIPIDENNVMAITIQNCLVSGDDNETQSLTSKFQTPEESGSNKAISYEVPLAKHKSYDEMQIIGRTDPVSKLPLTRPTTLGEGRRASFDNKEDRGAKELASKRSAKLENKSSISNKNISRPVKQRQASQSESIQKTIDGPSLEEPSTKLSTVLDRKNSMTNRNSSVSRPVTPRRSSKNKNETTHSKNISDSGIPSSKRRSGYESRQGSHSDKANSPKQDKNDNLDGKRSKGSKISLSSRNKHNTESRSSSIKQESLSSGKSDTLAVYKDEANEVPLLSYTESISRSRSPSIEQKSQFLGIGPTKEVRSETVSKAPSYSKERYDSESRAVSPKQGLLAQEKNGISSDTLYKVKSGSKTGSISRSRSPSIRQKPTSPKIGYPVEDSLIGSKVKSEERYNYESSSPSQKPSSLAHERSDAYRVDSYTAYEMPMLSNGGSTSRSRSPSIKQKSEIKRKNGSIGSDAGSKLISFNEDRYVSPDDRRSVKSSSPSTKYNVDGVEINNLGDKSQYIKAIEYSSNKSSFSEPIKGTSIENTRDYEGSSARLQILSGDKKKNQYGSSQISNTETLGKSLHDRRAYRKDGAVFFENDMIHTAKEKAYIDTGVSPSQSNTGIKRFDSFTIKYNRDNKSSIISDQVSYTGSRRNSVLRNENKPRSYSYDERKSSVVYDNRQSGARLPSPQQKGRSSVENETTKKYIADRTSLSKSTPFIDKIDAKSNTVYDNINNFGTKPSLSMENSGRAGKDTTNDIYNQYVDRDSKNDLYLDPKQQRLQRKDLETYDQYNRNLKSGDDSYRDPRHRSYRTEDPATYDQYINTKSWDSRREDKNAFDASYMAGKTSRNISPSKERVHNIRIQNTGTSLSKNLEASYTNNGDKDQHRGDTSRSLVLLSTDNKGKLDESHIARFDPSSADGSKSRKIRYYNDVDDTRNTILSREINRTLSFIYENELIPLQNVIKALKGDIDVLAQQQILLREKLYGSRSKLRSVKRCCCKKYDFSSIQE